MSRSPSPRAADQHGEHAPQRVHPVTNAGEVDVYELRRGFVEHVTPDVRAFLSRARRLNALAPIRHLTRSGARGASAALRFAWMSEGLCGDPTPISSVNEGWSQWSETGLTPLGRELITRHGPRA